MSRQVQRRLRARLPLQPGRRLRAAAVRPGLSVPEPPALRPQRCACHRPGVPGHPGLCQRHLHGRQRMHGDAVVRQRVLPAGSGVMPEGIRNPLMRPCMTHKPCRRDSPPHRRLARIMVVPLSLLIGCSAASPGRGQVRAGATVGAMGPEPGRASSNMPTTMRQAVVRTHEPSAAPEAAHHRQACDQGEPSQCHAAALDAPAGEVRKCCAGPGAHRNPCVLCRAVGDENPRRSRLAWGWHQERLDMQPSPMVF